MTEGTVPVTSIESEARRLTLGCGLRRRYENARRDASAHHRPDLRQKYQTPSILASQSIEPRKTTSGCVALSLRRTTILLKIDARRKTVMRAGSVIADICSRSCSETAMTCESGERRRVRTVHLGGFKLKGEALEQVRLMASLSLPQRGFHVMLKEHRRSESSDGKFKDAERKSQTATSKRARRATVKKALDFRHSKLGDRVRRSCEEMSQIIQTLPERRVIRRGGVNCHRPRQMLVDLLLIILVAPPAVIGEQPHFVTRGQLPQKIV